MNDVDNNFKLMIMRHAAAESMTQDIDDFHRPLLPVGHIESSCMGRWIRKHGPKPEHVFCSSARRAQETAKLVIKEIGLGEEHISPKPELYQGGVDEFLALIEQARTRYLCLLLIGHNPTMELLGNRLLAERQRNTSLSFPTASMALFISQANAACTFELQLLLSPDMDPQSSLPKFRNP